MASRAGRGVERGRVIREKVAEEAAEQLIDIFDIIYFPINWT